jgi:hypothetical protein
MLSNHPRPSHICAIDLPFTENQISTKSQDTHIRTARHRGRIFAVMGHEVLLFPAQGRLWFMT